MKEYVKRWSEQEFKDNPQLSLIPALYARLKKEGVRFKTSEPVKRKVAEFSKDPNVVSSNQEEEDIAKAIELSLKETTSPKSYSNKLINSASASLYPSINGTATTSNHTALASINNQQQQPTKESYKVRALYDFEAAEDNEITFKAGEILMVIDDSDSNWWKGSNHRGEGLFPANFCTKNLDEEIESSPASKLVEKKSVQFNEEVRIKLLNTETVTEIDEKKIDRLLYLLHEADPTGERLDSDELIQLEEPCLKMGPLIDTELEIVDKTHASLSGVNSQLVDALNIYCALMKEDSTYSTIAQHQQQQSYLPPQQQPHHQQPQLPPNFQNSALNPHLSYGQAQLQLPSVIPYSSPYVSMPGSMTQNPPYNNHIYSSPNGNHHYGDQTSTTYTANQMHYIDANQQQQISQQQQFNQVDHNSINTSVSLQQTPTTGHQPISQQQQMINQANYQQQQPTSMALPTNQ